MQQAERYPANRAWAARTLLVLLLATHAFGGKCPADCDTFKINEPPEPDTGFNGVAAASAIIAGIANAMISPIFSDAFQTVGYIGGGLFTGIFGVVQSKDTSEWDRYQQQKDLKQQQDYFACVMESQISQLAYEGKQYMDDQRVQGFNNAVSGVVTYITDNCAAHNCLNVSRREFWDATPRKANTHHLHNRVEPSRRNNATGVKGATCVHGYKTVTPRQCAGVKWDWENQVQCQGADPTGRLLEGICGEDGLCYQSSVTFTDTIDKYQQLKNFFLTSDAIKQFNAFDEYAVHQSMPLLYNTLFHHYHSLWNPTAVVAYAKGAIVYLALLQELYMLGSASAEEGTMRAHANRTATWLQSRIDYHTNRNVSLVTVADASSFVEPVTLRYSCRSADLYDNNAWLGCQQYVPKWNGTMDVCLFPPNTTGNAHSKLCACDCSTDDKKNACYYGPTTTDKTFNFEIANFNSSMTAAADALSARNDALFNTTGVYNITATLRQIAALNPIMPSDTAAFYQKVYTPRQMCVGGLGSQNGQVFLQRHGMKPLGRRHKLGGAGAQEGAVQLPKAKAAAPPKAIDVQAPPKAKAASPPKAIDVQAPPKAKAASPPKAIDAQAPPKAIDAQAPPKAIDAQAPPKAIDAQAPPLLQQAPETSAMQAP